MAPEYMLTTTDNPFNPFTEYKEWYTWDVQQGYHTAAYLGRIVRSSEALSEQVQDQAIDNAMDDIILENPYGNWVKVEAPEQIPDRNI